MFLDIIYKNLRVEENGKEEIKDVGIQYKFKVENGELVKYKCIEKTGNLSNYYSYNIINGEKLNFNELKLSNS